MTAQCHLCLSLVTEANEDSHVCARHFGPHDDIRILTIKEPNGRVTLSFYSPETIRENMR